VRLAVLDTNVIVSAGIRAEGAPEKLVMDWVLDGQVQLVTSPLIVEEYRAIARRPKFHRFGFPPLWLEFLIEESMYLSDPVRWPHAGPDPKDMPFLALAHSAGAWLVTGNLRHFPREIREGVTVLSPTDYLAHLMKDTQREE
jgi:putative PIN family toxin of toxin-antitoxin system